VVIQSIGIDQEKQLAIHSDLLSGRMEGRFSFRTLTEAARRTMGVYLPSVASPMEAGADSTHFTWALTVNDTQELSSVLKLPLTVYEPSFIHGEYRTADNHIRLNGHFPLLQFKALTIENGTIAIANPNDALEIRLSADQQLRKGDPIQLSATLRAENDSIRSSIRWNDDALAKTRGILDFTSHLSLAEGPNSLAALIRLEPSEMVFNDSVWTISPALAKYSEGRIDINSLEARHNNQRIAIAGIASKDTTDRLRIALDAVNLDYIFQSLAIRSLTFGGIATGYVTANDLFTDERKMETHLDVQNFSFNNTAFGDLNLDGAWNEKEKSVEMLGKTARNDSTYVRIDGQIFPYKQEISFHFDAHRGNAAFLRKYINNIARDLTGQITGQIHLFGHWNDPTVEGIVRLDDASFGIDFLNARYSFSDTIRMTPTQISVQDLTLFDQNGNTANVTGAVDHTLLQNFSFSAQLKIENNFLIYAATPQTNPTFFGKAYASGTGSIKGNEKDINIEMTLQNNDNTDLTFNFMEQSPVADYDFINFLPDSSTLTSTPSTPPTPAPASPINILTKLTLTATPAATVTILINPATGDKITASGEGNIGITFGNRIDPHINGTYNIARGAYNFSFQQALTILFNIEENSKVSFRGGGPLDAILDIKASHEVSANLSDLDRQLTQPTEGSSSGSRDNILVKCILILTKELQHPTISFDLELPGPNAEYEQQLKNYIRTPDALNRQIAYLLLMKRFYKAPEYARNDARTNDELSLLISAIPSYILSLLGNVSDKLHVDTKFRQTYENGETNTEMELRLSSNLLKNRLIINGNFGYINNPTLNALNDNAPIIGDFDVEYMLTKNGNIRLKGFNRYNYRNYYSLTPEMTQGLGILFRRDFNTLNDLFFRPLRPKPADKTE
jgi:hypothetical protein